MKKLFLLLLVSFNVSAVTITWVPPTTYVDGSSLDAKDIANYMLVCWENSVRVVETSEVPGDAVSFDLTLPKGVYGCKMRTIIKDGNRSAFSNAVGFTEVGLIPDAPSDLNIKQ